jgi:hypothetical protein
MFEPTKTSRKNVSIHGKSEIGCRRQDDKAHSGTCQRSTLTICVQEIKLGGTLVERKIRSTTSGERGKNKVHTMQNKEE